MKYETEFYKTPEILEKVLTERKKRITGKRIVFCGCGTSFYIGGQIANICRNAGINTMAVDAINVIEKTFGINTDDVMVFISRSGNSLETILAMEEAKRKGAYTFYLGCTEKSVLYEACEENCTISYAKEENILESYSYFAQLVMLALLCGIPVSKKLPDIVRKTFDRADQYYVKAIKDKEIKRVISLGSPFYMPLLQEMRLKDGEITRIPSENWGILEFRHGPRSWADQYSLIEVIPGTISSRWDENVVEELVNYGCNVRYYSENILHGAYHYYFDLKKYSIEEVAALGAFHACVAIHISQKYHTKPEELQHMEYHVGEL